LPCNAARCTLISLVLSVLATPIASSQDVAKAKPKPHVSSDSPALTFDFPGVKVGVAEYEEGPTGTTVLYFPTPVVAAVDVRGGAPGTLNTDALRLAYDDPIAGINAIVLSGGSSCGLSAATGVANALKDMITDSGNFDDVATVAGAIIFDLGDRRFNTITPDEELGRAALASARAGWFPHGARGAGRFAMQSLGWDISLHSGQGAAFRQSGDTKVLVVTVNNGGLVVDRKGQVMRCLHPVDGHCGSIADAIAAYVANVDKPKQARADFGKKQINPQGLTRNTTLTVVLTNKSLPIWALQRLGVQVHNSMARGDQPMAEGDDGDTLFTVTTGKAVGATIRDEDMDHLGILASETGWDWVSLQLDDHTELMLFHIRRKDGSIDPYSAGTYVDAAGKTTHLRSSDFTLEPVGEKWKSPTTGAAYPIHWRIALPSLGIELEATTPLASQEMTGNTKLSPNYWEGAIALTGHRNAQPLSGAGYLEMTGYDHPLQLAP
jgi:6-aminohexanoate-oligomer endohydrolase